MYRPLFIGAISDQIKAATLAEIEDRHPHDALHIDILFLRLDPQRTVIVACRLHQIRNDIGAKLFFYSDGSSDHLSTPFAAVLPPNIPKQKREVIPMRITKQEL